MLSAEAQIMAIRSICLLSPPPFKPAHHRIPISRSTASLPPIKRCSFARERKNQRTQLIIKAKVSVEGEILAGEADSAASVEEMPYYFIRTGSSIDHPSLRRTELGRAARMRGGGGGDCRSPPKLRSGGNSGLTSAGNKGGGTIGGFDSDIKGSIATTSEGVNVVVCVVKLLEGDDIHKADGEALRGTVHVPVEEDIGVLSIHHVGILCENLEKSLDFYQNLLGLQINAARPHDKLPYRGAWLWVGDEMIHLMELPNPDPLTGRPEHGGRDRHACIAIRNVTRLKEIFDKAGIKYTLSRSGRPAIFTRDPDGNALEFTQID